jgi:replicative DNA helicase Mcm
MGVIGEAGTGKSSLLEAAESISPRSGYVSGKNATKAGVTAAAVRDDFGDTEWSLDSGAIVKAHKGLCCIDEIDKVEGDVLSSLHTALEKQRLEVNKAGIDASLRCHTSVLAAGNPEEGEFIDEMNTLSQINLDPPLRSRFDLLFTLRDRPEHEHDKDMAEHMAKMRQLSGLQAKGHDSREIDEIMPAVDIPVLRAWIAYAREHVNPVIEDTELIEEIGEWFADERTNKNGDKTMNRRMVGAVSRLAEASARVRLSDIVAKSDIERASKIIEQSLQDLGLIGENATVDIGEVDSGTSKTQRERVQSVLGIIQNLQTDGAGAEVENVIETAQSAGIERSKVKHEIDKLKQKGDLYEPKTGSVRTT